MPLKYRVGRSLFDPYVAVLAFAFTWVVEPHAPVHMRCRAARE